MSRMTTTLWRSQSEAATSLWMFGERPGFDVEVGEDQSGVGAALCRAYSKTPLFFRRHALEEGGVCRAATDRLFENDRIPPPTGEHGTAKKSPAEARRRREERDSI